MFTNFIPFSVMVMLFTVRNEDAIGIVGGILCGVQLIVFVLVTIGTERALRNNFDENGNLKR